MKTAIILTLVGLLAACAAPLPTNPDQVAAQVGIHRDPYTKAIGIAAEPFSVPGVDSLLDPAFARADLRGWIAVDGREGIALHVYYHATTWKFYASAVDIDGHILPVSKVDTRLAAVGSIEEQFEAQLSRDYVTRHATAGMNIKFVGKYGNLIVQVPAAYVQGFMQRFDAERQAK